MLHKGPEACPAPLFCFVFYLQNSRFSEWARLGSNQRPLPCEGSTIGCWRFLELAEFLQISVFLCRRFFPVFQEFPSRCCTVAAQQGLLIHLPEGRDRITLERCEHCLARGAYASRKSSSFALHFSINSFLRPPVLPLWPICGSL